MRVFDDAAITAPIPSEYFDLVLSILVAFHARGTQGLSDTDCTVIYVALTICRECRTLPGAEERIRQIAPALAFCLQPENDLDFIAQVGSTTGCAAAQLCECSLAGAYTRLS